MTDKVTKEEIDEALNISEELGDDDLCYEVLKRIRDNGQLKERVFTIGQIIRMSSEHRSLMVEKLKEFTSHLENGAYYIDGGIAIYPMDDGMIKLNSDITIKVRN